MTLYEILSGLGLEMMYQSATVQANFDYISESDMQRKINVSAFIQPIVTGLFSNSPFKNSKLSAMKLIEVMFGQKLIQTELVFQSF